MEGENRNSNRFSQAVELLKALALDDCPVNHLNEEESLLVTQCAGVLAGVWNTYLDRMIKEVNALHADPITSLIQSGLLNEQEMEEAAKYLASVGITIPPTKTIH